MVLGIVNPLSWIFHAISNEKSFLIVTYNWREDSKFPALQLYARINLIKNKNYNNLDCLVTHAKNLILISRENTLLS